MFIIKRLIFMALVPIVLFFGASLVLESFAESQLSTGIGTTLGLRARPSVEIDAFPIIWRVIQGRIPRILVTSRDLVVERLEIAELSIEMRDVRANIDVLIRSNRFDLHVGEGEGTARITEDSINAALKRKGENARATFRPDGTVFVRADRVVAGRTRRFEATGRLTIGGRTLTFRPSRVTVDGGTPPAALAAQARRETTVSVVIPKLPGAILPSEVIVTEGQVALVMDLEGYVLRLKK